MYQKKKIQLREWVVGGKSYTLTTSQTNVKLYVERNSVLYSMKKRKKRKLLDEDTYRLVKCFQRPNDYYIIKGNFFFSSILM